MLTPCNPALLTFLSHQITFDPPLHPDMNLTPLWIRLCLLFTAIVPTFATPATPISLVLPLSNASNPPIVNLGYATYQGYYDSKYGLNIFKGCAAIAKILPFDPLR